MRELMLRLLTYEPFEEISGDEKNYIDAVLNKDIAVSRKYPLYHSLMFAFKRFCDKDGKSKILAIWFRHFYMFSKSGSIGVLCYKKTGDRTYYPVLFKKICFYCITEYNFGDADFLANFGIKPNILNKWEVSTRYRKLIYRDSYHAINIRRNGKKQPYLTKVIKAAFYEASRQEAVVRFFDPATKGWVAPKKEQLLPFVDVFAGSGCVAASVDANEIIVNDFDIGVACFLYSMAHDEKEVRTRLAELHNSFVSRDLSNGANHYTYSMWKVHKLKVAKYCNITDVAFDDIMVRIRNNYEEIYKRYISALGKVAVDFSNPSENDIRMYYDIGVAWYFMNAIGVNGFSGNAHKVTDMDTENYYAYLEKKLEVFNANSAGVVPFQKLLDKYSGVSYKIISKLTLKPKDIKFGNGKSFMKALKKAHVQSTDFSQIVRTFSDGFIYEDSPYFLTAEYETNFGDGQHKMMLDQLRGSDFKWLFSMQYKNILEDGTGKGFEKPIKGLSKRKKYQKKGNPIIRNYGDYYAGFSNEFIVKKDKKGLLYYTADYKNLGANADKLYVILFNKAYTGEMLICNFDMKRVIPYGGDAVVLSYRDFMKLPMDGNIHRMYDYLLKKAKDLRADNIVSNYASGVWV